MVLLIETEKNPIKEPLEDYCKRRIKKNKNNLILIVGETGSGKSFSSLRLGLNLDDKFNIDRVCFYIKEFLQWINSNEIYKGFTIIIEEGGYNVSRRQWQSINNKLFNFVMQTFRNLNINLILNVPYEDMIDSQTIKLFHIKLETMRIDKKNNEVILKPLTLQYSPRKKKIYTHYIDVLKTDGDIVRYKRYHAKAPPNDLIQKYEAKKTKFTQQLNKMVLEEIEQVESEKEYKSSKRIRPYMKPIYELYIKGITNKEVIAQETGLKVESVAQILSFLRVNGHIERIS